MQTILNDYLFKIVCIFVLPAIFNGKIAVRRAGAWGFAKHKHISIVLLNCVKEALQNLLLDKLALRFWMGCKAQTATMAVLW